MDRVTSIAAGLSLRQATATLLNGGHFIIMGSEKTCALVILEHTTGPPITQWPETTRSYTITPGLIVTPGSAHYCVPIDCRSPRRQRSHQAGTSPSHEGGQTHVASLFFWDHA